MAGSVAHAYYKEIPKEFLIESFKLLDEKLIDIVCKFTISYIDSNFGDIFE